MKTSIEILNWAMRAMDIPVESTPDSVSIIMWDGEHVIVDDYNEQFSYWHSVTNGDGDMVESHHGFGLAEVEHRLRLSL